MFTMFTRLLHLHLVVLLCTFAVVTAEASARCHAEDLKRAKQRVPRAGWKSHSFSGMAKLLTSHLSKANHVIRPCAEWSVKELQHLLRHLFQESEQELLAIYDAVGDNRRQRFKTLHELETHWMHVGAAAVSVPGLERVQRDGLCHEAVMSAAHHLSAKSLKRMRESSMALPSLPLLHHELLAEVDNTTEMMHTQIVRTEYEHQVSCQQCHTGTIVDPKWQDATLPKPVAHSDKELQRLERQRTCDYQAEPPCGPCEGLGGKRWGDGLHDFTSMQCTVIHGPEIPPTTKGRYPELGSASLTGETRSPLAVRPRTGENVTYFPLGGNISVDYRGKVMFRQRYDFGPMGAEVSVQTYEQAKAMDPGATIGAGGPQCSCSRSIAGLFHQNCFDPLDPLDPLKLPADQGGAAYLGRVMIKLDGATEHSSGNFTADHFMKWAFHFLVDADEKSPSFGLPLRLYAPFGVRQVFDNWQLEDPEKARPDIWRLPQGCNVTSKACSLFPPAGQEAIVV